ncbi:MAG: hypothetical protein ABSH22_08040 [Tepidisphaeraceae bacterium]
MTTRKATQLLWRTAVLVVAAGVLTIGLAAALPLDTPSVDTADAAAAPATSPSDSLDGSLPALADFAKVWSIDLGHNVVEQPPPSAADAVLAATPPPTIHVIGTIVEPGHSLAMILGGDGKTVFQGVGDVSGGAKITAISIDSVTFDVGGKAIVYQVEKPPAPAAPPPSAAPATVIPAEEQ